MIWRKLKIGRVTNGMLKKNGGKMYISIEMKERKDRHREGKGSNINKKKRQFLT